MVLNSGCEMLQKQVCHFPPTLHWIKFLQKVQFMENEDMCLFLLVENITVLKSCKNEISWVMPLQIRFARRNSSFIYSFLFKISPIASSQFCVYNLTGIFQWNNFLMKNLLCTKSFFWNRNVCALCVLCFLV